MFRTILYLATIMGFMAAAPAAIHAQTLPTTTMTSGTASDTAPAIPEEMTKEAIDSMVARMSDDQVRAFLLLQLDANAVESQATKAAAPLPERLAILWTAATSPTLEALKRLPILVEKQGEAIATFAQRFGGGSGVLTLFGLIALVLVIGYAAERILRTAINKRFKLEGDGVQESQDSLWSAVKFLLRRFLREILGLIIFYITIRIFGRILLTPEQLSFAGPFVASIIWMPRVAAAFSRFLLAPSRADRRLVNVDDHTASFLHRNLIGIFLLSGFTLFIVGFNARNGITPGETRIGFWLDSAVYVYVIFIAWTARDGLRQMMLGTDPDVTDFDRKTAQVYPFFAMGVAVFIFLVVSTIIGLGKTQLLLTGAHYATLTLLLAAPVIDTAIRGIVRHVVPPMLGEGPVAEEAYRAAKRGYIRIGRVISVGVIIVMIANAWEADILALLQDTQGIADNLFSFAMTCVVGYVVYEGVSLWINRQLAKEMTAAGMTEEEADAEMGGASGSRLSTVLPLALVSARSTIIVVFGLLAIGNLGIDITPLLAGAGIAGLAIGFGAQKLVSDVVSGVFFLVDDAFRVGEYVEIAGTMGAVEKISIRSMQLRHHRGPVHTIPYGEIPQLTNYSRDWVIMKLKFTVPFDTDPNKVKKIFKKIGQEMLQDELFKDDFLQPFKSQGVFDIDDVGMVIRGKFMAKPGKQFMIRKEIYNKVKAAFAENGIDFARREVRVAIPGMEHAEDMTEEEKAQVAAAGAAAAAAQQQEAGPSGPPKGPD